MPGLTGVSTAKVGADIVTYMDAVAKYFEISIRVTSGYRDADEQASAMFNNWSHLKKPHTYKVATLPDADRLLLTKYWTTYHAAASTDAQKEAAKTSFLKLAKDDVGTKSMHTKGRALDISRLGITKQIYHAIALHLHDVKEGNRKDIYHFESKEIVPAVDAATMLKWGLISKGSTVLPARRYAPKHCINC